MKRYILDTNICIYLIKKRPAKVFEKFQQCQIGQICISAITLSELELGVSNSAQPQKNQMALYQFLIPIDILDYPCGAAQYYGELRSHLKQRGSPIGANDLLIAAHALSLNIPIVTNNTKEFNRVPNLQIENWI